VCFFQAVNCPEGGSASMDTTGYIYTAFYRIGEFRVENGHITYKIKDQSSTIQSGDLGAVANPFRQVKYLAIRVQRYSGYDINEMRIHAINLYAGQHTYVPEPVEADGTSSSTIEKIAGQHQNDSDQMFLEADSSVETYWTGPWPTLHIIINKQISLEVGLSVTAKVDLLASASVENVEFKLKGLEQLSVEKAANFISVADEKIQSNSVWVDVVHAAFLALWCSFLALAILSKIPFVVDSIVALACLITIGLYLWFMWSIVFAVHQMELNQEQAEWTFITATLSAFSMLFGSALVLHSMPLGFLNSLGYFSGGWTRSNSIKGSQGRSTVLIFFTMLFLIFITVITYYGLTQGWW
jgi:hypothetical protein